MDISGEDTNTHTSGDLASGYSANDKGKPLSDMDLAAINSLTLQPKNENSNEDSNDAGMQQAEASGSNVASGSRMPPVLENDIHAQMETLNISVNDNASSENHNNLNREVLRPADAANANENVVAYRAPEVRHENPRQNVGLLFHRNGLANRDVINNRRITHNVSVQITKWKNEVRENNRRNSYSTAIKNEIIKNEKIIRNRIISRSISARLRAEMLLSEKRKFCLRNTQSSRISRIKKAKKIKDLLKTTSSTHTTTIYRLEKVDKMNVNSVALIGRHKNTKKCSGALKVHTVPLTEAKLFPTAMSGSAVAFNHDGNVDYPEIKMAKPCKPGSITAMTAARLKMHIASGEYVTPNTKQKEIQNFLLKLRLRNDQDKLRDYEAEIHLIEMDLMIKSALSLSFDKHDLLACLFALDNLKKMPLKPVMLLKYPDIFYTIKLARKYIGNAEEWKLSDDERNAFDEKAKQIRNRATLLFNKFRNLFWNPKGKPFAEHFAKLVNEFNIATREASTRSKLAENMAQKEDKIQFVL